MSNHWNEYDIACQLYFGKKKITISSLASKKVFLLTSKQSGEEGQGVKGDKNETRLTKSW